MGERSRRVVLPLAEWRELGARGRREVRRAARRGVTHPDPYVARLAHAWATEVLRVEGRRPSRRQRIADTAVGAVVLAAIGALLGPAAAGASSGGGLSWPERRLARRILTLTPPAPEPGEKDRK